MMSEFEKRVLENLRDMNKSLKTIADELVGWPK